MRYVLITSSILTQPKGTIVSQERLGMTDDKLDEFIEAGYAIEAEVEEIASDPKPKQRRSRRKS